MSIFKIETSKGTVEASKPQMGAGNSPGDSSVEHETIPTEGSVHAPESSLPSTGEAHEKKDKMVRVDGPIGRIFTDALNEVLAKESLMVFTPMLSEKEEDVEPDIEVLLWDGSAVNRIDVEHLSEEVAKFPDRQFIVAVENVKPSASMALLGYIGRTSKNIQLCYSQQKAAELVGRVMG